MRLPNADSAVVDLGKLTDYCLIPNHSRGRHKARVFRSALDITADDAAELRSVLLDAARTSPAVPTNTDEFGQRDVIEFAVERNGMAARVRSAWVILHGEEFPWLITCHII